MGGTSYGAGKFNNVDPLQFSTSSDDDMPISLPWEMESFCVEKLVQN